MWETASNAHCRDVWNQRMGGEMYCYSERNKGGLMNHVNISSISRQYLKCNRSKGKAVLFHTLTLWVSVGDTYCKVQHPLKWQGMYWKYQPHRIITKFLLRNKCKTLFKDQCFLWNDCFEVRRHTFELWPQSGRWPKCTLAPYTVGLFVRLKSPARWLHACFKDPFYNLF